MNVVGISKTEVYGHINTYEKHKVKHLRSKAMILKRQTWITILLSFST